MELKIWRVDESRPYVYLGTALTDRALRGARCAAVIDETGKCVCNRGAMLVVFDGETAWRSVVQRRLRRA